MREDEAYKTTKGELLNQLGHRCFEPGHWGVEAHDIRREGPRSWLVVSSFGDGVDGRYESLTAALEAIADLLL